MTRAKMLPWQQGSFNTKKDEATGRWWREHGTATAPANL